MRCLREHGHYVIVVDALAGPEKNYIVCCFRHLTRMREAGRVIGAQWRPSSMVCGWGGTHV